MHVLLRCPSLSVSLSLSLISLIGLLWLLHESSIDCLSPFSITHLDDKDYVRLQCDGFFDPLTVLNWGGIVFERKIQLNQLSDIPQISDSASPLFNDRRQQQSVLNYVDILHAGLRPELALRSYSERYAALTVFDNLINPLFENITVLYSASDGMNFSNVASSVKLKNSVVAFNRGNRQWSTFWLSWIESFI